MNRKGYFFNSTSSSLCGSNGSDQSERLDKAQSHSNTDPITVSDDKGIPGEKIKRLNPVTLMVRDI